ncbi:TPA: hypothetical protein ACH3X2_000565 [Trebouxia sp. C0005]
MSCLAAHDLSLCGKHQACRTHHVWLRPWRRQPAAGVFSFSRKQLSQPHTVPEVSCSANVARPHKRQEKSLQPGLPDISELSHQLQQEWHPDNNALLGGIKVTPGSGRRVTWSCPNCPAGCPHIWQTRVSNCTRGSKCPYCQGKSVCQHSSLATKAPRQAKFWNHDKNAKTPEQTLAGTNLRAEWKCPICSHEWQAQVAACVRDDSGCPCCNRFGSVGNSHKQPTFEAAQHPLLLEWDYKRNTQESIHPQNTTLGSQKLVHWVYHKCPQGQPHLFCMTPNNRTNRRIKGCPYCAGKQVCECNSLQTRYPMVSAEWDFAKNDLTPAQVTFGTSRSVWWVNPVRGSWAQRIDERTDSQRNPK